MSEIWELEANQITKLFRNKKISAVEVVKSVIERYENVNHIINAIPENTFEYAKKIAENLDKKLKFNENLGALAAVPLTLKINTDQVGFASTNGLRLQKNLIAKKDSTVLQNIQISDGIVVGRSNTPAFSIRWFTNNSLHGHTKNPHNNNITPGGSSGGAASATAAGIGSIGHGTDIAGSIRYPAYACGIHGLRPSIGRVPMINYSSPDRMIGGQIMAVSGPLARSIKDLEIGLKAMSIPNYDDPWWTPISNDLPILPKKIGLITKIKGMSIKKIIKDNLIKVAKILENIGWIVEEIEGPDFEKIAHFQAVLWLAEFRRTSGDNIFKQGNEDAIFIYKEMSKRCPDTTIEKFMDALQQRATLGREWSNVFDQYPLLLCPVSGDLPFPDLKDVKSVEDFNEVFNSMLPQIAPPYLGIPGLTFSNEIGENNIPIGVQFLSRKFREDKLFEVGYDLEKVCSKIKIVTPNF